MAYESIFKQPDNFFPYPQQSAENSQQQTNAFQPPQPPPIILDNPAEQLSKVQEAVDRYGQNQNPQLNLSAFTSLPSREQNMTNFIAGISTQPNLTAHQMTTARNLFDLKTYYDNIEKGLAANKDLPADKVAAWRNKQKNIADTAAMIRRTAEANDFNPDAYGLGSGNTLGESAQALHYLQNRDMKNFLDLKSAAEKASDRYNELRAQGVEPYRANYLANREFDGSRRDVMNQLSNALHTYGINPDGSYNSYGHQIMEKMYAEDPEIVKDLYTSQFVNPKERYSAQQTLLNNLLTQAGADNRAAAQIAANIYGQQFGAAIDLKKLAATLEQQYGIHKDNLEFNYDNLTATKEYRDKQIELEAAKTQNQAALNAQRLFQSSPEGKLYSVNLFADYLGLQGEERARYIRNQIDKNPPDTKKLDQARQTLERSMLNISKTLKIGDYEKAKELISALKSELADTSSIYVNIPVEDDPIIGRQIEIYEGVANKTMSASAADKAFYDLMNPSTSPVGNGDEYMDRLRKNPAIFKAIIDDYNKNFRDKHLGFGDNLKNLEEYIKKHPSMVYYGSSLGNNYVGQNPAETGYGAKRYPK